MVVSFWVDQLICHHLRRWLVCRLQTWEGNHDIAGPRAASCRIMHTSVQCDAPMYVAECGRTTKSISQMTTCLEIRWNLFGSQDVSKVCNSLIAEVLASWGLRAKMFSLTYWNIFVKRMKYIIYRWIYWRTRKSSNLSYHY